LSPPLVIGDVEFHAALGVLEQAIRSVAGGCPGVRTRTGAATARHNSVVR
jgi:acyl CoA:acetate/3-ketoacid CoA transferase